MVDSSSSAEHVHQARGIIERVLRVTGEHIIGQDLLRKRLLQALIADGHILLEGVPGLAKTLAVKVLAQCFHASFKRIQFTPDLLPADLIGTEVYRPQEGRFEVRKGPIFANFILADEINRAPAKVQSALLETMQERQVTIGHETFPIPQPFVVMATQNPIEQEGTYPLPEAQVDRFMIKVKVDYPSPDEELRILTLIENEAAPDAHVPQIATTDDIVLLRQAARQVYVDEKVRRYMVDLVNTSRKPTAAKRGAASLGKLIELGASPRATLALFAMARAEAFVQQQAYVSPQNVKDVAYDVLRHRILLSYEAEAQGLTTDNIIETILESVEVP